MVGFNYYGPKKGPYTSTVRIKYSAISNGYDCCLYQKARCTKAVWQHHRKNKSSIIPCEVLSALARSTFPNYLADTSLKFAKLPKPGWGP